LSNLAGHLDLIAVEELLYLLKRMPTCSIAYLFLPTRFKMGGFDKA
jgi:hypothetical protein